MDNAGDWLYIVFLIVAGLSSLLGSKKKKRPTEILGQPDKDVVVQTDTQPQKGFWEILQEMQKEPEVAPQPTTHPVFTKKIKQEQKKKATPSPFLSVEERIDRPAITGSFANTSIPEKDYILAGIELDNAADIRKAIIYAEILNRKY